jgi:hypothetical protein
MVAFIALSVVLVVFLTILTRSETKPDNQHHQIDPGLHDFDAPSGEPWVPDKSTGSVTSQREKMRELFKECGGNEEKTVLAYAAAERAGEVSRRSNDYALNAEEYARRLFADGVRKDWIT